MESEKSTRLCDDIAMQMESDKVATCTPTERVVLPIASSPTAARNPQMTAIQPRVVSNRERQYRVIFREPCVTVSQLSTLGEVTDLVNQTLGALRLLYLAGWVHRDIGTGNVVAYRCSDQAGWKAKLCDLEYAKKYSTTTDDGLMSKMGMPYFMPVEILKNGPLLPESAASIQTTIAVELHQDEAQGNETVDRGGEYESDDAGEFSGSEDDESDYYSTSEDDDDDTVHTEDEISRQARLYWANVFSRPKASPTAEGLLPKKTFVYTFQHDLESLWWISLYSVTARVNHKPSQQYAKKIFQHRTELWEDRRECLARSIAYDLYACLRTDVRVMGPLLDGLRRELLKNYFDFNLAQLENGLKGDTKTFAAIHRQFFFAFEALMERQNKDFAAAALI